VFEAFRDVHGVEDPDRMTDANRAIVERQYAERVSTAVDGDPAITGWRGVLVRDDVVTSADGTPDLDLRISLGVNDRDTMVYLFDSVRDGRRIYRSPLSRRIDEIGPGHEVEVFGELIDGAAGTDEPSRFCGFRLGAREVGLEARITDVRVAPPR
jgi:hypothetical protein